LSLNAKDPPTPKGRSLAFVNLAIYILFIFSILWIGIVVLGERNFMSKILREVFAYLKVVFILNKT